ncbi:hypothetical protein [Tepidibacillus sp. HK-1]|nr:hypothetical protein [Tepidibacillus sp. HK-1]
MQEIAEEIKEKWPESKIPMSHRVGKLAIERLKQIVPVWKKEIWEG